MRTSKTVAVIGLGNIGMRLLVNLRELGYDVFGVDERSDAVEHAASMGFEAHIGDALSYNSMERLVSGADVAATVLPGSIALDALRIIASLNIDVVDVSFFPWNPELIPRPAGNLLMVDAGLAPGLSNVLAARLLTQNGTAKIYVGGVSASRDVPLGLSITWNPLDLLDEYLRPARMISDGSIVTVRPLDSKPGRVRIPGIGVMEYFPTDGLRSLMDTFKDAHFLAEYTLRWPGHIETVKLLDKLGLLSGDMVKADGCLVEPRRVLASLLRKRLAGLRDLVVLLVVDDNGDGFLVKDVGGEWSAMSRLTAGFQATAVDLAARGLLGTGLRYPEFIGLDDFLFNEAMGDLYKLGVKVEEIKGFNLGHQQEGE